MNLKRLCNSFNTSVVGGMYGKFCINTEGKYILSRHGRDILREKEIEEAVQFCLWARKKIKTETL